MYSRYNRNIGQKGTKKGNTVSAVRPSLKLSNGNQNGGNNPNNNNNANKKLSKSDKMAYLTLIDRCSCKNFIKYL